MFLYIHDTVIWRNQHWFPLNLAKNSTLSLRKKFRHWLPFEMNFFFHIKNHTVHKYLHFCCSKMKKFEGRKRKKQTVTLRYLIAVHARLLIFLNFSSLHILIRYCTFINFSEIFQPAQKFFIGKLPIGRKII